MDDDSDQHFRRQARQLAEWYQVSDEELTHSREHIQGWSVTVRYVFIAGWMQGHLIEFAGEHRNECQLGACRTCRHIGESLAMVVATQQASTSASRSGAASKIVKTVDNMAFSRQDSVNHVDKREA